MQDELNEQKPLKKTLYQRVMKLFVCTLFSVLSTFFVMFFFQIIDMNIIIARIISIVFLIIAFKWLYKNTIIYKRPRFESNQHPRKGYQVSDINDPRNPFSYTTPGSINYSFPYPEEDRFRNMKSSYDEWNR